MDPQRLIHELLSAAEKAGIQVRELSPADAAVSSGLVIIRGQKVLFLHPGQTAAEQAQAVARALRGQDLDQVYLSPGARDAIEGGA